jgi:hypothetical protein
MIVFYTILSPLSTILIIEVSGILRKPDLHLVHLKGVLKKSVLECESLSEGSRLAGLSQFSEIEMCLSWFGNRRSCFPNHFLDGFVEKGFGYGYVSYGSKFGSFIVLRRNT